MKIVNLDLFIEELEKFNQVEKEHMLIEKLWISSNVISELKWLLIDINQIA